MRRQELRCLLTGKRSDKVLLLAHRVVSPLELHASPRGLADAVLVNSITHKVVCGQSPELNAFVPEPLGQHDRTRRS